MTFKPSTPVRVVIAGIQVFARFDGLPMGLQTIARKILIDSPCCVGFVQAYRGQNVQLGWDVSN